MKARSPAPLTLVETDTSMEHRPILHLRGAQGETIRVSVVDNDIIRVTCYPDGKPRLDRTWIVSGTDPLPREGRLRDSRVPMDTYSEPQAVQIEHEKDVIRLNLDEFSLHLNLTTFSLTWYGNHEQPFAADLPINAYEYDANGRVVRHYMRHNDGEHYYGFGEVAGSLDKAGMRIRMSPRDALGYNAETSDPLYKHFPFYITFVPQQQVFYGILYDNVSDTVFDMGKEIDYTRRARYRYWQADDGDFDFYLIMGWSDMGLILNRLASLTGFPMIPPRWSLGYLGSSMQLAEAPDSQEQLKQFAQLCQQYDIPCDGFHLSSGYTTDPDGRRCVFTWNRARVPDPVRMVQNFHDQGIRVIPNVKPHLLVAHPYYEQVKALGGFLKENFAPANPESRGGMHPARVGDTGGMNATPTATENVSGLGGEVKTGNPALSPFWSGGAGTTEPGSLIDFTSAAGFDWWKAQVKSALLDYAMDAIWNDNNEFQLTDDSALCDGFGSPANLGQMRPIQSLLMARASYEALAEHRPGVRPFVLTRSGGIGSQRYAQTWSGDNFTSWHTLKWNIPMGLSLSLSGQPNVGHDVGGFFGEAPDPELFVRWVQNGVFHPRFTIHSWHTDGSVNAPWMYPEVLPIVREWIKFRYRLIPYLYKTMVESSMSGEPTIRPLVFMFPHDERTHTSSFEFMLGNDLLVASVFEAGARTRTLYLPKGADWYDFYTGQLYAGGQEITVDAPLDRIPLFARAGAIILAGKVMRFIGEQPDNQRHVYVFPPRQGVRTLEWAEDDGMYDFGAPQSAWMAHPYLWIKANESVLNVQLSGRVITNQVLPYNAVEVILPPGEMRTVEGSTPLDDVTEWGYARRRVRVELQA